MTHYTSIKAIVTDIEGTTSSISFVKEVLFPYAKNNMDAFIRQHQAESDVALQLDAISNEQCIDRGDVNALIQQLVNWIESDVKATPLKAFRE